jgi:hypothetical protein
MIGPFDYYLDPTRGAIPEWDARIATMSWEPWLTFDAISVAPRITIPVQMVHSRDAAVPDGAQAFFDELAGPKDLFWTTAASSTSTTSLRRWPSPPPPSSPTSPEPSDPPVRTQGDTTMDARTDILETVTRLFWHSDHHDWHSLASVFADSVRIDYTALTGGGAVDLSPAEIVETWRPGFEAIDAHQHLVTNHLVSIKGHEAIVTAAFQATHEHAGRSWTLGGDYRFRLTDEDGAGRSSP